MKWSTTAMNISAIMIIVEEDNFPSQCLKVANNALRGAVMSQQDKVLFLDKARYFRGDKL